jgi:hypothetical protein
MYLGLRRADGARLASSSRVLSASLLLLLVWWIIPRQMASVILLAVQAITALICNVKQPEVSQARKSVADDHFSRPELAWRARRR